MMDAKKKKEVKNSLPAEKCLPKHLFISQKIRLIFFFFFNLYLDK